MKLTNSIKEVIVGEVNKTRSVDIQADDVSHSMFLAVAKQYVVEKGVLPEEWSAHMVKVLAYNRYKKELIAHGYDALELEDCSLIEMRDMVSALEYIEVRTCTTNGGVRREKVMLKAA